HVSSGLPGSRQGGITRASGGPIPMIPGAAQNVDSVPVLAMPDEHMWTKSEVAAVGGHSAMYRLRAAALAGELRGCAARGAVAPSYLPRLTRPPPVAVGARRVSARAPSRSLPVTPDGRDWSGR